MTPYILIGCGIILIAMTIRDIRNQESNVLFLMGALSWHVNKTENPLLYRIALVGHFFVAQVLIAIGGIWLAYFR